VYGVFEVLLGGQGLFEKPLFDTMYARRTVREVEGDADGDLKTLV